MVGFNDVQAQLMKIDARMRLMSMHEVRWLANELEPKEQIMACLRGWYRGSMALLCATDKRLLIIDQANAVATSRTVLYDQIKGLRHVKRKLHNVLIVFCHDERHEFKTWRLSKLDGLLQFVERHMAYLKTEAEQTLAAMQPANLPILTGEAPMQPYTGRGWRTLMRRIGNASMAS